MVSLYTQTCLSSSFICPFTAYSAALYKMVAEILHIYFFFFAVLHSLLGRPLFCAKVSDPFTFVFLRVGVFMKLLCRVLVIYYTLHIHLFSLNIIQRTPYTQAVAEVHTNATDSQAVAEVHAKPPTRTSYHYTLSQH